MLDQSGSRIVRHDSALGKWESVRRPPRADLAEYVRNYTGYRQSVSAAARRLQTPSEIVPMIIEFGAPVAVTPAGGGKATRHQSFVAGMHDSYVFTESSGESGGLQIDFTPLGAYRFFGVEMDSLTNRLFELEDVVGRLGRELASWLEHTPDWGTRFELLDGVISARIASARVPSEDIAWAWHTLQKSGGRTEISSLTDQLRCSRKHLVARFREYIGLTPKTAARVLRFSRTVRLLDKNGGARWTALAQASGYYDQPHMIRDFAQFAGLTPSEFLRRCLPDEGGVSAD